MSKSCATLGSTGVFAAPVLTPAKSAPKPSEPAKALPRPDREGRKPLPFWTTEAAKKQLRMMAAEMDTTQQDLMTDALNMLFQSHGKPPIA